MINIRRATIDDALSATTVLKRSISELCYADHGGKKDALHQWLSNKTPENFDIWVCNPNFEILLAECDDDICGICMYSIEGDILLNYVSPDFRFQSVSTLLLSKSEKNMQDKGVLTARLKSTKTAVRFYQSRGWKIAGQSAMERDSSEIPMVKTLESGPKLSP